MKYLAAVLAVACSLAAAAPPQPRPSGNLRQVLQEYDRAGPTAEPRQLTATERAELRRQLSQSQGQGAVSRRR